MREREGQEGTGPPDAGDPAGDHSGIEAAARLGAALAARREPAEDRAGAEEAAREAAWADAVGPSRAAWYVERFRRFQARDGGFAPSWNWVCAFFPLLWLLYRKMYGWAAALVLANFVLVPALGAAPVLTTVASLALMCALPALANWLYYRHVTGIVLRAAALPGDEAARRAYRAAAGGVSWVGPIAVMGLTVLGALLAVSGAGLL